jgi:putative ABC transport system permease protein
VVNSVLLEPMHFFQAKQLVVVRERNLEAGFPEFSLSPGNYLSYRDENHSFSGIAASAGGNVNYVGAQEPERLRAARVTSNFFDVLHAQPMLGRAFTKEENEQGADHVAILSYGLWQRRFGARNNVLGERINLSGEMYAVVGVMPKDFDFPSRNELWRPLTMERKDWLQRGGHYLQGIGRLKPGSTPESAGADLNTIARRLQQAYPNSNHGWDTSLIDLQERVVGRVRPMMLTLLAAVGFVLLIACVNLANLLLSRSASRRREIGIRGALGAGKARLIRQLLTESLMLSAFGTARVGAGVGGNASSDKRQPQHSAAIHRDLARSSRGVGDRRYRRPDGPPLWTRPRPANGARRLELVAARRRTRQFHGIPAQCGA